MPTGKYTRVPRNILLQFDIVTAARLSRAAENDHTTPVAMLHGWVLHNIDTIDPEGASGYVAPAEEDEQP